MLNTHGGMMHGKLDQKSAFQQLKVYEKDKPCKKSFQIQIVYFMADWDIFHRKLQIS